MSKYGLYKLDSPTETSQDDGTVQPMSQPADTTLNAVQIYADGTTHNWYVIGSGQWNNNNWYYDNDHRFFGNICETYNIGGLDSIGVAYYSTSGTYGTTVLDSGASWWDGLGNTATSSSSTYGTGQYGASFAYQDKISLYQVSGTSAYYKYLGYGFQATIVYSPNFQYWNGKARTAYTHTSTAALNEIQASHVNINKSFSFAFRRH